MPYPRLDILAQGPRRYKKKPHVVRLVSSEQKKHLEARLKLECSAAMNEYPHMRILGLQYICPDAVIQEICRRAIYTMTVDDLNGIPLLRTELKSRFCNIVMNVVGSAPPAKRRRQM